MQQPQALMHHSLLHHHQQQQQPVLFSSATAFADNAASIPHLRQLHAHLLKLGAAHDISAPFLSKLLSFSLPTASPSSLHYALSVFRRVPDPRTATCNRLLRELSRSAEPGTAVLAYARMRRDGVPLDRFSFPSLLKALGRAPAGAEGVRVGREVHGFAAKLGFDSDPFVQTGLVRAYSAGGCVDDARRVFDHMPQRDVVAWGVMLDGYCQSGRYMDVLSLFDEMTHSSAAVPDQVVLVTVLSACGRTRNLNSGRGIHSYITDSGMEIDEHLRGALINMYASCGSMDLAQQLYDEMCPKNLVASTAMVFGYAKAGMIDIARSIFDGMQERDLVSWSAMVSGYVECEQPHKALVLFNEMRAHDIRPDRITMLSVISACADLGALDKARWIHAFVDQNGFRDVTSVNNALIDMYSKCGSQARACRVFEEMPLRNVISWTSMINGYAMHGDGGSALKMFDKMKDEGIEPNDVTFIGLLYACAHSGLVDDGRRIFTSMVDDHRINPKYEHYGCMVDLLGRAKLLHEAMDVIDKMPFEPNVIIWGSLLGSCRVHGDLKLGELAAKRIIELDPDHDGAYVLLSNIYAKAGRWQDIVEVRKLMKYRGVLKERGCSWTESNGEVHEFATADESHPKSSEIYAKLDQIVKELELSGYIPDIQSVLVDLDEEEKRRAILAHSEKLALSFKLIDNAGNGSCIRIAKNLRVCEDCHSFMKAFSRVFVKEIVLRDRTRFHHFKDGTCSCKDFW
uniref:Pentatricopeptide repeat-containing protein At4g14820 n=1 Tax=Anthurium amnicola TaxID=1678845 RepID=A0A1D1ZLU0_9ARAE